MCCAWMFAPLQCERDVQESKRNATSPEAPSDQSPGDAQARRLFCAATAIGVGPLDSRQERRAGIDQQIVKLALEPQPKPMTALRLILAAEVDAQAKKEIDGGVIAEDGLRPGAGQGHDLAARSGRRWRG